MNNKNFIETFEKLSRLWESKQDIENFKNKFGERAYDTFKKYAQRLKNNDISTDLVWHTKNTSKEKMETILNNLQNRIITKDGNLESEAAGKYEFIGESDGYKVYHIKDYIAAINFGFGTGWCISGRYEHYGEPNYIPDEASAKKHWRNYKKYGPEFYFLISDNNKYAVELYSHMFNPNNESIDYIDGVMLSSANFRIYNAKDELDYPAIKKLPMHLIPNIEINEVKCDENKLVIENNVIIYADKNIVDLAIPANVVEIKDKVFHKCTKLKSIEIPNSVTTIGRNAFEECTALTRITIPKSVKKIGEQVFKNCTSLKEVIIEDGIDAIKMDMFRGCSSLENVVLPESIIDIYSESFKDCIKLKTILIPDSVTCLHGGAFSGCEELTDIKLSKNISSILCWVFKNCKKLRRLELLNNIKRIEEEAFVGCESIEIVFPESVEYIDPSAFKNCKEVKVKTTNQYVLQYFKRKRSLNYKII